MNIDCGASCHNVRTVYAKLSRMYRVNDRLEYTRITDAENRLTHRLVVTYTPFAAEMIGVRGSGSVVEHLLAKEKVAGSNPVFRSTGT